VGVNGLPDTVLVSWPQVGVHYADVLAKEWQAHIDRIGLKRGADIPPDDQWGNFQVALPQVPGSDVRGVSAVARHRWRRR